jgi:ANTAR domain
MDADVPDLVNARLRAQLDTMPVIEQAKGIIMAPAGCAPEAAFDLLRRASQRALVLEPGPCGSGAAVSYCRTRWAGCWN